MYVWHGAFQAYAEEHPAVGEPTGPVAYVPDDWVCAVQVSVSHLLLWNGSRVTAIAREVAEPGPGGCRLQPWADPTLCDDLGIGQQLKDLLPEYDRPAEDVARDKGLPLLAVYAVQNGLMASGFILRHQPPRETRVGFLHWPAGVPVPADWAGAFAVA